jgi:hypothetical protein
VSHSRQANADRFIEARWEVVRDEIAAKLIPMLIEVFRLPTTIHLKKYPDFDTFAVFSHEGGRLLGECKRPGGAQFYMYYPIARVSFLARVLAFFSVLWGRLTRERVKFKPPLSNPALEAAERELAAHSNVIPINRDGLN